MLCRLWAFCRKWCKWNAQTACNLKTAQNAETYCALILTTSVKMNPLQNNATGSPMATLIDIAMGQTPQSAGHVRQFSSSSHVSSPHTLKQDIWNQNNTNQIYTYTHTTGTQDYLGKQWPCQAKFCFLTRKHELFPGLALEYVNTLIWSDTIMYTHTAGIFCTSTSLYWWFKDIYTFAYVFNIQYNVILTLRTDY